MSSSLPSTRVLLGYLTNGRSRERQNLRPNWFGRAQTLTFLADLCAATTGTLSNNPRDPNQEAEDGLYLFCTFWVITFRFSGLERRPGAAKHRKPNVRGGRYDVVGKTKLISYITWTFMCPWWYKETLRSASSAATNLGLSHRLDLIHFNE